MKKLNLFSLIAAGMLYASCSSDSATWGGQEPEQQGKGFVSVTINLPTTPSTRAINDDYDDGKAGEYKVNDAKLLLFYGTSEADATFYYAANLTLPKIDDVDNDNITTSYQSVAQVNGTYTANLWALVLINTNGIFDLGTLKVNDGSDEGYTLKSGVTKISDLQGLTSDLPLQAANNFFMTNAVLSNVEGGAAATAPASANLSVLAKLKDDCIKETEAEAKANPAGSIFVERAVAKATLSVDADACTTLEIDPASITWALDNMEPTSYLVRNMGTADYIGYSSEAFTTGNNFRFVGNVKLGTTPLQDPAAEFYRTYWCVDPQYATDVTSMINATDATYGALGIDNPQYCHENTFDVTRQKYRNTTRAIIKVQTTGKATFYTVNGANTKYELSAAQTYLQEPFIADAGLKAVLEKQLASPGTVTITADDFEWDYSFDETTGKYTINGGTTKVKDGSDLAGKLKEGYDETAVKAAIASAADVANAFVEVLKYTDGVMYYEARFMHFASNVAAEDLAPWNTWESTKPSVGGIGNAYPGNAEQNYLGRYGMVRNNWYDVKVSNFNHIGSPVEPKATLTPGDGDTPDDNVNSKYISVKINVLSWAKRTQGWEF